MLELPDGLQQDELLYSAVARGARPLHVRESRDVLRTVFGATSIVAVIDLPSRLDEAGSRLLCLRNRADAGAVLLHQHTLYPFYAAVADPLLAERAATLMRGEGGSRVHGMLGVRASSISAPGRLRWCSECLDADRGRLGYGWWRRAHQLAGALVCPVHARPLLQSSRLTSSARERLAFHDLDSSVSATDRPTLTPVEPKQLETLHLIAQASAALLDRHPDSLPGLEALWRDRMSAMRDAGFARGNRQVDGVALRRALDARFGADLLQALGCTVGDAGADDWVARMSRRPRAAMHPLYHVLFAVLLGRALVGMGSRDDAGAHDHAAPGEAVAEMRHPQRRPEDDRLRELVGRPDLSLRRIAAELAIDPLTVKRRAHLLGVWRSAWTLNDKVKPASRAIRNAAARLVGARRRWRAAHNTLTDPTRGAMRRAEPAAFALLYRRDRDWLEENSPPVAPSGEAAPRVDWAKRDSDFEERITAAMARLEDAGRRCRAIRPATLARRADALALLQQHAERMPRSSAALIRYSEDSTALARSRIARETDRLLTEGASAPGRMVLARAAGIGPSRLRQLGRDLDKAVQAIARGR